MPRHPVDVNWFRALYTVDIETKHRWLRPLASSVESIANIGCWSEGEVFSLLWQLDAGKIVAIDLNPEHMWSAKEIFATLKSHPSIEGRSIEFLEGDITKSIPEFSLPSFDLAYCENVLYQIGLIDPNLDKVQVAISEMHRIVKPGGFIVAVEPKVGAVFEEQYDEFLKSNRPVRITPPTDISHMFQVLGSNRIDLENAPRYSYIFQKVA